MRLKKTKSEAIKPKLNKRPEKLNPNGEKIQKILAKAGVGSRRQMEEWIKEGRVKVNKNLAHLGQRVLRKDKVFVDGKLVQQAESVLPEILIYNKPEGEICSKNPEKDKKSVFDSLPEIATGRWIAVGRLDLNTSGLLLFTNDGDLANKLMHPSQQVQREYAVRVFGEVTEQMLERMVNGVKLDDGLGRFEEIQTSGEAEGLNQWYHVVVVEGRNRLVRRLWESQGVKVSKLKRVRYGDVFLPSKLRKGQSELLPRTLVTKVLESL